jgi:hypothetical protein
MPAPHAVAARWADLWSTDRAALVADVYDNDAVRVDLTRRLAGPTDAAGLHGREALLSDEERLYRLVPDHRVEPLRLLVDGATRCVVEGLVTGTSSGAITRMAAPALWWWELDGEGRIRREWRWFDWDRRRLDDGRVGGVVPDHQPPGTEMRSQGWYRTLADRLAETWSWDPELMVRSMFAEDCVVGPVDDPERRARGQEELEAVEAARAERLPRRRRRFDVLDVLGDGRAFAIRYSVAPGRAGGSAPATTMSARPDTSAAVTADGQAEGTPDEAVMVATLDVADRITSARLYGRGLAVVPLE